MTILDDTIALIVKLTGEQTPFSDNCQKLQNLDPFTHSGIGYSQFNELLLTLGYDRVTKDFFKWFFRNEAIIASFEELEKGVDKFCKTAMLLYGNIKYAFKHLSQMDWSSIEKELQQITPIDEPHYTKRHEPIHKLHDIPPDKAYYLGYIVEKKLKSELDKKPNDQQLLAQQEEMHNYRQQGWENHQSYLVSDHMDVYIATSMRERYEFLIVSHFVEQLFQDESLKNLRLRYFNPTQAYCKDRIDKGLVEGLMLKRARCTIYHVQESDTLGKDSELATTLAQGKPVIAYIPTVPDFQTFTKDTQDQIEQSSQSVQEALLKRLQRYYPEGAWKDQVIRDWIEQKSELDVDKAMKLLHEKVTSMYDKRAETLKNTHPLGLQVNLSTGVANGVLVVRSIQNCALLLRSILLNTMEFYIEEKDGYIFLKEGISDCIYRVTTGDDCLTNAFWNFYL